MTKKNKSLVTKINDGLDEGWDVIIYLGIILICVIDWYLWTLVFTR